MMSLNELGRDGSSNCGCLSRWGCRTGTTIAFAPGNLNTLYVATSGRGQGLTNLDVRLPAVSSNALYAVTSTGIFKAID
ncbi:MAG TPA: hypothetical protein VL285_23370 [Bryobacteraceae bacterium]|nr:hypothetical protein [Bryobacteraceae bacterium]